MVCRRATKLRRNVERRTRYAGRTRRVSAARWSTVTAIRSSLTPSCRSGSQLGCQGRVARQALLQCGADGRTSRALGAADRSIRGGSGEVVAKNAEAAITHLNVAAANGETVRKCDRSEQASESRNHHPDLPPGAPAGAVVGERPDTVTAAR